MIKKLTGLFVLLVAFFALVGCAPKDPAAAKEKLEKAEYVVVENKLVIPGALKLVGVDGIDSVLVATKSVEDGVIAVTLVYFGEKADAKAAYEKVQEYAEKEDKDSVVKQSGNWIYFGSEQAVKDFN